MQLSSKWALEDSTLEDSTLEDSTLQFVGLLSVHIHERKLSLLG